MLGGRWEPQGLIFRCSEWEIAGVPVNFAQSPQAMVFDSFVRIYFTTRMPHPTGRGWFSFAAYCDFTKDLGSVLAAPSRVLYESSGLGTFDEDGIFPFSPFRHENRVLAYTTGWSQRVSVDVETGIGLMESTDGGITFRRSGAGPLLSASINEPFLVCDGFVLRTDDSFTMWYSFGTGWSQDLVSRSWERTYKIGQIRSSDPTKWDAGSGVQVIENVRGDLECQALPTVVFHADEYHMAFCHRETFGFREKKDCQYDLGYAVSSNGKDWVRNDAFFGFERTEFDSEMRCYPHIFESDGQLYLLYNGNNFGELGFGLAKWKT